MSVHLDRYKIRSLLDNLKRRPIWLSEQSGMSKAVISRVMNGHGTTYETADAIAKALGVSADELRVESPGPRYEIQQPSGPVDLNSAVGMLTEIHKEDRQAWEWITGNLVMFTRALKHGGRGKKARDAGL